MADKDFLPGCPEENSAEAAVQVREWISLFEAGG